MLGKHGRFSGVHETCRKANRQVQATPGVEGYVFDGADGSQMAF